MIKFSSSISLNFLGGNLSSDTGLLLIDQFSKKIGLQNLLEKYFPDNRIGSFEHVKKDILYQEIIRIIGGYASNNRAFALQNDPVFKEIHGKIASSSTCCRLEQTFSFKDMQLFQKLQSELLDIAYKIEPLKRICFDLDSTKDSASPTMYGSNYNSHYGNTGFHPLLCYNGLNGDPLKGLLRSGNVYTSRDYRKFMEPLFQQYVKMGIKMQMRADSGFAANKFYEFCEQYNVDYFVKMKMNKKLQKIIERFITSKVVEARDSVFFETQYKANSWKKERRVLIHIEWKPNQLLPTYSAVVTSDEEISSKDGFMFYNGRGNAENMVKESKNGFYLDRLSSDSYETNAVKLQIALTSHLLANLFRRFCMSEDKKTTTIQTLRNILLKVASRVVKKSRTLVFKCASSFPFQKLFISVFEKIQKIPSFAPG